MVLSYFRGGMKHNGEKSIDGEKCAVTRLGSTGPAQRQLLLDFEEDLVCVVRQVARYGVIGGTRIFPSGDGVLELLPEEKRAKDGCA